MRHFLRFTSIVVIFISTKLHAETSNTQSKDTSCEGALEKLSDEHMRVIDELVRLEQRQLDLSSGVEQVAMGEELKFRLEEIRKTLSAAQKNLFDKLLQQQREGARASGTENKKLLDTVRGNLGDC